MGDTQDPLSYKSYNAEKNTSFIKLSNINVLLQSLFWPMEMHQSPIRGEKYCIFIFIIIECKPF